MRESSTNRGEVEFIAHPPERRSRPVILAGGCCTTCCCCCCCLHVLGGVLGAAMGSTVNKARDLDPARAAAAGLGADVYWLMLCFLTPLAVVGTALAAGIWSGLGVIFVGFPAVQLLASLATAIVLAVRNPPDVGRAYGTLARITLFGILGAGGGGLVMLAVFGGLG